MKAIRYHQKGGPEVLVYEDVPDPVPAPGQVLLRVLASGVNYADATRRSGNNYPRPTPLPFTPGSEVVGVVERLGANVTGIDPGTIAIAWLPQGGYAEYAVADVAELIRVPVGVEPTEAPALIIQGLSAALILKKSARLQKGESVLIHGAAGGVGVLAVQLAKIYGAGTVIGAASTEEKRALVLKFGADAAVDYTQTDWTTQVREANGGRPVDVILAMTGGDIFDQSLTCLAPFGRVVAYGNASHEPMQVNVQNLLPQNQTITGFFLSGLLAGEPGDRNSIVEKMLDELGEFIRAGRLRLHLGGTYKLSQASDAHRAIEGRHTTGKIVLVP